MSESVGFGVTMGGHLDSTKGFSHGRYSTLIDN